MTPGDDQPRSIVFRGGRVIDPSADIDRVDDLVVRNGAIDAIGGAAPSDAAVFDASGMIVCPGLIDIHVHLRAPGGEHKETIATGTAAAAAGGFTAVACMPNTRPAIDTVETLEWVRARAEETARCRVYPIAAVTRDRKGRELTDMAALKAGGAVAFSDDGDGVEDDDVMRAAFQRARETDAVAIQHCEYKTLSAGGVMHKGEVSQRLGVPGLDPRSEEAMIERDIALVRETGARYHVAHISTAKAVDLVRRAKADGLPVTTEVCTHHLTLTDAACGEQDPNTKMHPPLRPRYDVDACIQGLIDGAIDCICTDHAPHSAEEKAVGFLKAPPGIVGLETSLALAATTLVQGEIITWPELIRLMSTAPARVLGLTGGTLAARAPADITVIDPESEWRIDPDLFLSKSRNTPFGGRIVAARAILTCVGGNVRHQCPGVASRWLAGPRAVN
jgi:dihydroorotase